MENLIPSDLLPYILIVFVLGVIIGIFSRRFLWGFIAPLLAAVFFYGVESGSLVGFAYALFLVMTPPLILASGVGAWLGINISKKLQNR
ncbi:hypothetical protein [Nitrosococcus wardiae]|uniref:Uncharacterized protein n=1 Tax=Nitrosococcus wardiae TaxID=1814290 RepID=A0A4P7BXE5_9GAMM|nr:hypothetical protein [Nitrosococcus wardiae]QBQ53112.1 hypothetical protein E3U44_00285 [Nitrosococcus wardiae]